jgi:glycopeptide antibiotics resistance protein
MKGTQNESTAIGRADALAQREQTWLIESQAGDAGSAVDHETERPRGVAERVEAAYITVAILVSLAFLYASTVPLVFASPDFDTRIAGVLRSWRWNPSQPLDPAANVLAFIPVGFLWSAAWNVSLKRRRRRIEALKAASTCLALAVLAEGLQFWIPLRDPSIRDVLALECGALLGCELWRVTGHRVTAALSRWTEWLMAGRAHLVMRAPALFISTYLACLMIVLYANPVRLFLAYRDASISLQHIALSRPNLGLPQPRGPLAVLVVSGIAALLLVGACRVGVGAVRSLKGRDVGR